MSEALYERYKDALRRGHVAALRGRLDAALIAYAEAANMAPERPLPHASLGSVLLRLGRREDALAAYGVALGLAPRDETALAGRAEVLTALGRRVDAADVLDRLAEAQEDEGRVQEACDTARRALALAESKGRRAHVERLALRLRDGAAPEAAQPSQPAADVDEAAPAEAGPAEAEPAEAEPAEAVSAEAEPPDPVALTSEAEDDLARGDVDGARKRLLAAASAHRSADQGDAALDACYLALAIAPGDPELHLLLAELYLDRGWREPATEKILLLDRLIALSDDTAARDRICALIAERLPDEPRVASLCA
ncbi:MAG TPA: tetratricopeptide repeat protein [Vitreimonas sp.]|nr:tetratricopeptide repeat protein [Vitreimonas sp.]